MKKTVRTYFHGICLFIGTILISCEKENEFAPFPPSLRFQNENSVISEREKAVVIPVIVKSPVGIKSLSLDGQPVGDIVSGTKADTVEIEYIVPANASVGEVIELTFELTDIQNVSSTLKYEVNVIDFIPPVLSFPPGNSAAALERNQSTTITLILNAPNKIQSLTANGQSVSGIVPGDVTGTVQYNYTTAVNAPFGPLPIEFVLTDQRGKSDSKTFVVTVTGSNINMSTLGTAGVISTTVTLEKENVYRLDIPMSVANGGVLNIPAGTKIYAVTGTGTPGLLTIQSTGQINAIGSATNPVVFTSDKELTGSPAPGDWVGIQMNGTPGTNLGTLKYVRIEYGGGPGAGIDAGLRLNGVTAPTTLEYIQVFRANDVGVYYRNASTVPMKYIVATQCVKQQFFVRDANSNGDFQFLLLQTGTLATLAGDVRALEVRQSAGGGRFSNMSIIGPGADAVGTVDGIRTDRRIKVFNSLVAEFPDDGIRFDNPADITTPPNLSGAVFANSYVFKIADLPTRDGNDIALAFETNAASFSNVIDKSNVPAAAAGITKDNFVPSSSIISVFDPTTLGSNFVTGSYVGAVGTTDWTIGWVKNPNGTIRQ
jgi:hypothetical protein